MNDRDLMLLLYAAKADEQGCPETPGLGEGAAASRLARAGLVQWVHTGDPKAVFLTKKGAAMVQTLIQTLRGAEMDKTELFKQGKRMFRLLGPWEQERRHSQVMVRRDILGNVKTMLWQEGWQIRISKNDSYRIFDGNLEEAKASADKDMVEAGWELVDET
jgi:hypothetical protein